MFPRASSAALPMEKSLMPGKSIWRPALVLAALVALALIPTLLWWSAPLRAAPPSVVRSAPSSVSSQVHTHLEARAQVIAQQRLTRLPAPIVPEQLGGFPREAVVKVVTSYGEMLAVQGLYNQHSVRERLVANLLETPHGADIAARTLSDPAFAHEAFDTLQAEARFFSIKVLKEAARRGNEPLLLRTAGTLSRDLSRADDAGRARDLRELLEAYTDVHGPEGLAKTDTSTLDAMGCTPGLPDHVKTIYDDVFFYTLKRHYGRKQAAEITQLLLER